jgi:hypothetical protein
MKHENPVLPEHDPAGPLARMVAETRYQDIPAAVTDLAKRAILDTLAVTVAGSGWEVSPAIADQVAEWGGAPQATVLIHGHQVPAPMAAFANGVMARAIDMGDVHETGGHVTEWNVPAMLSVLGIADGAISGRYASDSRRELSRCRGSGGDFFGGLLLSSFPMPREEFMKAVLWDVGDPCEDVGEPGERIDVVEPSRAEQAEHHRRTLAATV